MIEGHTHPATTDPLSPHPHRRRIVVAAVALVLLLALALTPPLLNVNRLQRRIATSMSASLGRPVHLDSVTLHLLPMPGFTLQNLVVSEDPAFGYEPVIRANTVEATLRTSSLWRRQVEFSTLRFVEPSVNLVRNPAGKWNLQSLLMHAAAVETAPTAQRKAGPAPRFPYIEATGARVNLKLGDDKQPFSLTDADFALWLPSPQQWNVRLEGKPTRTDASISDAGTFKLEGTLGKASDMAGVPVELHASWQNAPLGEASKLVSGTDAGWRGGLTLEVALTGQLSAAALKSTVHVEGLRRADFVPARSLDLDVDCSGVLHTPTATVLAPQCLLRRPEISAVADQLDLTSLQPTGVRIGSPGVSEEWILDVGRLFSQRIPVSEKGAGQVKGTMVYSSGGDPQTFPWQGTITGTLGDSVGGLPATTGAGLDRPDFTVLLGAGGMKLEPVNLAAPGKTPPLMLSGTATDNGYTFNLNGAATNAQIAALAAAMPPLADGVGPLLPTAAPPDLPHGVDITCSRHMGSAQTCQLAQAAITPRLRHGRRNR